MSSPSVIFHQGLRCTKVRKSTVAAVATSLPEPAAYSSSSTSSSSLPAQDPTPVADTSQNDSLVSDSSTSSYTQSPLATSTASDSTLLVVSTTSHSDTTSLIHSTSRSTTTATIHHATLIISSPSSSAIVETQTLYTATATDPSTPSSTSVVDNPFESDAARGSDSSSDDGSQASLRTLLGSVFGGMIFIALVFAAFFFLYRYRRRKSRGSWGFGSEKPLRSGRGSPDSSTGLQHGYQSRLSLYSDGSSTRSLYDFISQQPFMASAVQGRHSNPFSDSARLPRASTPSLENTTRFPLIDTSDIPEPPQPPLMTPAVLPRRAYSADWGAAQTRHERINSGGAGVEFPTFGADEDSIHSSDRSLGSTVILPGRSSMGSSHLQRFSYQMSLAEMGHSDPAGGPGEPITRTSTRSDPFDLEVPPKAIHRRSSSALPAADTHV